MATKTPDRQQGFDLRGGTTDASAVSGYYDDWAATYEASVKSWNYSAPSDAAARLVPHLSKGDSVLDIGCGTGLFGQAMAGRGAFRLVGLDISDESLRLAKDTGVYAELTEHDLQVLPLPVADDTMDAAASVGVLTYLEDAGAMLRDACRCVRPGGIITFTQRTDRWAALDFGATVEQIAKDGLWTVLEISTPQDYLPGHEDFGQDIKIIHTVCRVV
ncbi:class I SAM-dependent DNA methyltransferase [Marinibacterium profundimaris]|uniref:Williams-Beuren syndrome chromosome region 27 n=1 Tax=Marinibacterium profundimaris TaxID=1679460 RepID=A0A225NSH9_9RHOB|nr:class I SAM-dependent methyltransferase [Marinibacterium profundimaris]OWU77280.1 Williams-Beuren syndrome chromosome region 27 [Marinibacterium profundimaris]